MKKTFLHRIATGLLALLLALPLASCNTQKTPNETTEVGTKTSSADDDTVTTAEQQKEDIRDFPIVADGKAVNIVYSMDSADAMSYATKIATKIKNLTGITPTCRDDSRGLTDAYDLDSYEIFVGNVNHPTCEEVLKSVPLGSSAILVKGHKLCLVTNHSNALSTLVVKLMANLTTYCDKEAKTIYISSSLYLEVEGTDLLSVIPTMEGKEIAGSYESTVNATLVLYENITESQATAYQSTILNEGYRLYSGDMTTGKTADAKNRFLTFTSENYVLTYLYTPASKRLRVIAEKIGNTSLGWREDEQTVGEKVCDATFTQVGICYDAGKFNGMSYVMRLEDGTFILFDGGHGLQKNADRLYKILQKQAPDPDNIVISAWVFSHSHEDHTGMFPYFSRTYADKVTVEKFIYNLPTTSQFTDDEHGTADTNSNITGMVGKYKGAKVINAHPGQVLYIHGAKIRILYTADLYLPNTISYGNTASMCLTVEHAGVTTMIMGDIGSDVASTMEAIYSDDVFASDVLQVAHHGIGSSPSSLYPKINPAWALMPIGTGPLSKWEGYTDDCISFVNASHNAFFKTSEKCKDHLYVANDDVLVLTYKNGDITAKLYDNDTAYFNAE